MTIAAEPKEVRFAHPTLKHVGVELMPLADLKRRVSQRHLATPERAAFFMLLLVTQGQLRHTVDFADMHLSAGDLVFVRPGQVQQWRLDTPVQGSMLMIDPPALLPTVEANGPGTNLAVTLEDWPVSVRLDPDFAAELQLELRRLARDLAGHDGTAHDDALVRQVLLAVLLRVARWHRVHLPPAAASQRGPQQAHRLFRRELEQRFREHWTVARYARRLGYSESTLNRACQAATGQTAKVLIDRRLALEAARMLVHVNASAAQVGHALGFTEPTNFVRFFTRLVGLSPTRFRADRGVTSLPGPA